MRLRLLSADDIFISYSRKDAATYALGLADALTKVGFSCFLDRLGTEANRELPNSLLKKLKGCAMLVVVGTVGAIDSCAIEQEISEFSRANGTSKIVPIDFDDAAQGARWQPLLLGLAEESETVDALSQGDPSKQVIARIQKSFDYARSKQRLRRYTVLAVALLTVSFVATSASYLYAQNQVARARAATVAVEAARKEADRERAAAGAAERETSEQTRLAKQAEGKRIEAQDQAAKARREAADALRQEQVAKAREREAMDNVERQEEIGASLRLASLGTSKLDDEVGLGLILSAEAVRTHDTYEARNGLLTALQDNSRLLASLDVGLLRDRRAEPTAEFRASSDFDRRLRQRAHRDAILSRDEKTFAARNASDVTLWDLPSGEIIGILDINKRKEIVSFALSPNGNLLALGSYKRVFLWDVKAGRELPEIRIANHWATELSFDPTGKYLAFISNGSDSTIYVVEPVGLGTPTELPAQSKMSPRALAFSADGKMLAASGVGVMVWEMSTMSAHSGWPSSFTSDEPYYDHVEFSLDGKLLVTASGYDNKIAIWDVAAQKQLRQFDLDTPISALALNHKGNLLVFGGEDGTIRLWDVAKMEEVDRLSAGRTRVTERLTFMEDDGRLMSVGEEIIVWNMSTDHPFERVIGKQEGHILDVAFSADGKYLASCSGKDAPIMLREAWSGELLKPQPLREILNGATSLAFSRNRNVLAIVTGGEAFEVQVWDINRGQLISTPYKGRNSYVREMAVSPDGKLLAIASPDLTFWDIASGQERDAVIEPLGFAKIYSPTFSDDGRLLAFGTDSGSIFLLDARTLKQVGKMSTNAVNVLAFSPDGRMLASNGSERGVAILWDVASRTHHELVYPGQQMFVRALAFSADGSMLALSGDPGDYPRGLKDHPIILWDTATRQPLGQPLRGHTAAVSSLAFSPSCNGCQPDARLVSGSHDGTLRMWDVSVASWQKRACTMANRRLTNEEMSFYFNDTERLPTCTVQSSFAAITLNPAERKRTPTAPTSWRASLEVIDYPIEEKQPFRLLEGPVKAVDPKILKFKARVRQGKRNQRPW